MTLETLRGAAIGPALDRLARLRIAVFRDWPYLYDGDLAYEARYLQRYVDCAEALAVIATLDGVTVGATTGLPLAAAEAEMQAPFLARGLRPTDWFYCGESVVLPAARGQGLGHRFFDLREAQARHLGLANICFCAVDRAEDHPARPPQARSNAAFWQGRGYRRQPELQCRYAWKDLGDAAPSEKTLTFWTRAL